MTVPISVIDPRTAPDDVLDGLWRVADAVADDEGRHAALRPPATVARLERRHPPAHEHTTVWVAGEVSNPVGCATLWWNDRADNRDHVGIDVSVHPDARGLGIGWRLLHRALTAGVDGYGARLVDAEAPIGSPACSWLERWGFEARLVERLSVCDTKRLDRALLERWVKGASERAAGYTLVQWDGPVPRHLVDEFCQLQAVMNTAPLEELDYDDEEFSPRRLAEHSASWVAQECDWWTVCARHEPTGELAGFTVLRLPRHWPAQVEQEDTGVLTAHRDRGLGRWLKATSALRLLDEHPEVERIVTWNAASNGPMLRLNVAMGFEGGEHWGDHQADARSLLARLDQLHRARR